MAHGHSANAVHRGRIRWTAIGLALGIGVALVPLWSTQPAEAATVDPFGPKTTRLFDSAAVAPGCYRTPAIVRTKDNSILAFAEHRVNSCEDKSNIRTVMRRLPYGSDTWQAQQVVIQGADGDPAAPATRSHAAPVVYRKLPGAPATAAPDGRVVLLSTHNPVDPARPGETHAGYPRTPYLQHSDDDGQTWSQPRSLYDQIDDPAWGHYATGPMHAIQLQRGPDMGRLVAGVNYGRTLADGTGVFGAMIVYSDDGGTTWHKGARREYTSADPVKRYPQEISLVELANGDLYAWARQQYTTDDPTREADVNQTPHRLFAVSKDGGDSFTSDGFQPVTGYEAPRVESSALRLRATDEGDPYNRILTSAPSVNNSRSRMTIRSSFDEGRTWQSVDTLASDSTDEGVQVWGTRNRGATKEECACLAGYSDMVELPTGEVGLIYERGVATYHDEIVLVRLNDTDLHTPATTPDVAGAADALAFDGTALTSGGRFNGGLLFDGITGRVQLPYQTTPVLGSADFTVSAWFRYGASSTHQAIFWAYGQNGEPEVWLRAEPGNGWLRGTVTTAAGATTNVYSAQPYNDGAWHHVALRRQAGALTMVVDGVQVGSATGAAGIVTGTDPTPIYLGQRMDGAHRFDGRMDEVRVYNRALTTAELTRLHTDNAIDISGLTARLPMNSLSSA